MASPVSLRDSILDSWKTNDRVTVFLVESLPAELWESQVPGEPRRTVRMLAVHLHNARCRWIKTLGAPHGIAVPEMVDRFTARPKDVVAGLKRSGAGILALLELGCDRGGEVPATPLYVWRNLPLDVGHVLGYFVAHEGHHRGQIVMIARQLGHRLPAEITNGLWQWTKRAREV